MIHQPIKMVIVSAVAVFFLFFLIVFIKKILKKHISLILLLFLISLLPLISMVRSGLYESGDLGIHVSFAMPFFESLKEGNLFPVWDKYMLGGYGYPYFLFTYPLPYYLASIIHVIGFSFIDSFKLIAAISYILSGFTMYFLVKDVTKKEIAGFTAAVFFLFAPYHLLDLHFRFAIGEIIAFAIMPLCFYLVRKTETDKNHLFIFPGLSFGALILSHQAISFIASLFLLFYILYLYLKKKDVKVFFLRTLGVLMGTLLTSFYWIPVIVESKFTYLLDRQIYFYPLINYIFSPSRYGLLYQGRSGELFFPLGYIHIPVFLIALLLFLIPLTRKKYFKKETAFLFFITISFFISFFMMLSLSKPLWEILPLIKGIQFSYRFSMFSAFFLSIIAGIVLTKIKNKRIIYVALSLVIVITILNWGNRRVIPDINDEVLKRGLYKSTIPVGPGTTIWTDVDSLPERKSNIEVISGKARIKETFRNSIEHDYLVDASEKAVIKENTLYFPNWTITINGNKSYLTQDNLTNGLIKINLDKGIHFIKVKFEDTKVRIFARLLSGVSLITLFGYVLFKKRNEN